MILREQIAPFHADFTIRETSLDFSKFKGKYIKNLKGTFYFLFFILISLFLLYNLFNFLLDFWLLLFLLVTSIEKPDQNQTLNKLTIKFLLKFNLSIPNKNVGIDGVWFECIDFAVTAGLDLLGWDVWWSIQKNNIG